MKFWEWSAGAAGREWPACLRKAQRKAQRKGDGMKGFRQLDGGGVVIEGREAIGFARLLVLRSALKLEAQGMRLSRGRSVASIVREEFGWKGRAAKLLPKLNEVIRAREEHADFLERCAAGDPTSIAQSEN